MSNDVEAARAVCNELLKITGEAMLAREFEAFAPCFTLPTTVETMLGRRTIDTREELKATFEAACTHYAGMGTTDLFRHVKAVECQSDTAFRASVECRILSGAQMVVAPYMLFASYVQQEGAWRISESIILIDDAPHFTRAISKPAGANPARAAAE